MSENGSLQIAERVMAERRLEVVISRLKLYLRALMLIRGNWRTAKLVDLRKTVEQVVPEAALFPLWDSAYRAKIDAVQAAEFATKLDHAIDGLEACLSGGGATLPHSILGQWTSTCNEYADLRARLTVG